MMSFSFSKTAKYLAWAFGLAWLLQLTAVWLTLNVSPQVGQLLLVAVMWMPFVGVLLSGHGLKDMGWKPAVAGKIPYWMAAWFSPALFTLLGALLYFGLFPSHFDVSGEYLRAVAGDEALQAMEAQGLTYPLYIAASSVACVTWAPLINMLAALGEEVGWRGLLYPQLKAKRGRTGGRLLGGVIWGVWHWPLIFLLGYEYGTGYVGFPVTGMLLFCLITVAIGILCDWVYEKTGCIWAPSLFHGAFNAAATIPGAICDPGKVHTLLGPAPNGLLAGLPLLIAAVLLMLIDGKKSRKEA